MSAMEVFPNPIGELYADPPFVSAPLAGHGKRFHSLTFPTGDSYEGQLVAPLTDDEDEPPTLHGVGVLTHSDGTVYKGEFINGVKHGLGITLFPNGDKHVGRYENNVYEGLGTYTSADGSISYVGGFTNGESDGNGLLKEASDDSTASGDLCSSEVSSNGSEAANSPGREAHRKLNWPAFDSFNAVGKANDAEELSETTEPEPDTDGEKMSEESDEVESPQEPRQGVSRRPSGTSFRGLTRHMRKGTKAILKQRSWTAARGDTTERDAGWTASTR